MPTWIVPACAVGSFALAFLIAVLRLSERFFATRETVAALEKETATLIAAVKHEAAEKLSKAVEDRRKDVAAMDALLRADHKEKMEAIEGRLLSAINESKADRKAGEAALFAKFDHLVDLVMKPRTGDTTGIPRSATR